MAAWLLILPLLVWITVRPAQAWKQKDLPLGVPYAQLGNFSHRVERAKLPPLDQDQRARLLEIIQQEYERTQAEARSATGPETSVAQQKQLIEECHRRIVEASRSALDDRQFDMFASMNRDFARFSENQSDEPAWNRTAPFYRWLVDFYFFIILPLSCIRGCGALIRDELQADTLGFLLTRPVQRASLVILKFICQAAWLEIVALLETLLLFGAGWLREIPSLGTLLPLFLAAQFLAVLAWSALGLFLGQVSKRYLALALIYGLVVELGIGAIPTNINSLSLLRQLKTLLSHNPDLQKIFDWSGTGVLLPVGILLAAAVIFAGLASLLFTFLEYHPTNEMQK
jgi:ABC-type transport system involved in multi-copper enzyme maturation permease subunit